MKIQSDLNQTFTREDVFNLAENRYAVDLFDELNEIFKNANIVSIQVESGYVIGVTVTGDFKVGMNNEKQKVKKTK
jgi:hypothetical protein